MNYEYLNKMTQYIEEHLTEKIRAGKNSRSIRVFFTTYIYVFN